MAAPGGVISPWGCPRYDRPSPRRREEPTISSPSDEADTTASEDLDDAELDRRWGLAPSEPLTGFGAPPVVAVMVTSDPGDWFEATLGSLADQDYESLSVLVVDNAGTVDPTPRIADALPTAFVKRLDADAGFSAAANEALVSIEGAAFYLFLHDDVRLPPDAVTNLVAEAFRANAGVVGPKLVDWDDPARLRSVGSTVDPYGFRSSIAEPGELDQSQHDTPREVFAVGDACLLIRADLFDAVGGFSDDLPYFGEDVDLCWRAHVAGARVAFCPIAVVQHRERFGERRDAENRERLELRHQARMMLTNYELRRLVRVAPVVAVLSLVDLLVSLVLGRFSRVGDIISSWVWNLVNLPSLVRSRARVRRCRGVHDANYLPLMRQGSSRLQTLVRGGEGENRVSAAAEAGRDYLTRLRDEANRTGVGLAVLATLLVLLGARDLFGGPIPVVREFGAVGDSTGALLSQWWTAWREVGLGEAAVPPTVVPSLGVAGTLLFGSLSLARRLLVLAPLFIGALGAWKLLAETHSTRARAAALAVYGLAPVALNSMAEGRLQALVAYAAAPWLLRRLAAGAGLDPFVRSGRRPARLRHLAGTGLLLAAVTAVTPAGAAVLVVSMAVLGLVATVGVDRRAGRSLLGSLLGGVAFSLPVSAPWLLAQALDGDVSSLTGMWTSRDSIPSATELITGSVGPVAVGVLGWGVLVAAGYCLVAGRGWRLGWGTAGWILALVSWTVTVVVARAEFVAGAGVELLLVPAVLGLALSVAMGALAFERDVMGSDFGAAQLLSVVAVVGLLAALVPVGVAAADGRWYLPDGDVARVLDDVDDDEDHRAVWIGDADLLPVAGWELDDTPGVAVGVTVGLTPTLSDRYHLDGGPGVEALREAVGATFAGETSRLGRVLAPMGVRYVVVMERPAPQPFSPPGAGAPDVVLSSLREQLDLSEVAVPPGMALFEVGDTWPLRTDLSDLDAPPDDLSGLLQAELPVPGAVLGRDVGTRFTGSLDAGQRIGVAETADDGWSLTVEGREADRSELFGWMSAFDTPTGGEAELRWVTPLLARVLQAVQVVGLLVLVVLVMRRRRIAAPVRRRRRGDEEPIVVVAPADGAGHDPLDDGGDPTGDDTMQGDTAERGVVEPGSGADR